MTARAPLFDRANLKVGSAIFVGRGDVWLSAMVTKVARKYFTASYLDQWGREDSHEFDLADGIARYRCIYRAWPSAEARDAFNAAKDLEYRAETAFSRLRSDIPYRKPDGVTLADIAEVRRLLKLPEAT